MSRHHHRSRAVRTAARVGALVLAGALAACSSEPPPDSSEPDPTAPPVSTPLGDTDADTDAEAGPISLRPGPTGAESASTVAYGRFHVSSWGAREFSGRDLSADPTTGTVWRTVPGATDVSTPEGRAALVAALGITEPGDDDYDEGDAVRLSTSHGFIEFEDTAATREGATVVPADGPGAEQEMRDLLTALGEDPEDYRIAQPDWQAQGASGAVVATLLVDGQPTVPALTGYVSTAGFVSLHGGTSRVEEVAPVGVVSEQEALERLSDPRFDAAYGGARTGADVPEPRPGTEAVIDWRVHQVEIVSTRLGLAVDPRSEGLVVPAYELTDATGGTWSVIAVDDDGLGLTGEGS